MERQARQAASQVRMAEFILPCAEMGRQPLWGSKLDAVVVGSVDLDLGGRERRKECGRVLDSGKGLETR